MRIELMLNAIIERKKITDVARLIGVARSTIYRTLEGKTKPSHDLYESVEALYKEVVENQKAS